MAGEARNNHSQLKPVNAMESDVLVTHNDQNQTTIDQIEECADVISSSLQVAMAAAENSHSGFYRGIQQQVARIAELATKLR